MKILLAEDEEQLSRAVSVVLQHMGMDVDTAENGQIAVELAEKNVYDCMVFDIMMPVMDGIEALKRIRSEGNRSPVIMLTAKAEIDDRVTGLDAGADDYLTKPFAMKELVARIRSQARRSESYTPKVLTIGSVHLDTDLAELKAENSVRLSQKEMDLCEFFMLNPDKDFTQEQIFEKVWAREKDAGEEIVWVYISYLKAKFQAIGSKLTIEGKKGGPYRLSKGAD